MHDCELWDLSLVGRGKDRVPAKTRRRDERVKRVYPRKLWPWAEPGEYDGDPRYAITHFAPFCLDGVEYR